MGVSVSGSTEITKTLDSTSMWAWELVPIVPSAVGTEGTLHGHLRNAQASFLKSGGFLKSGQLPIPSI